MEIDNNKRASLAKALLISVPFVMLVVSGLLACFQIILIWIPVIISGALVITGWCITLILRLKCVKFRFTDDMISVLYYPISPMTSSFKRIDIAAGSLLRYEISSSWMGLRKELILHENISGEDASYPPVSVVLCGKKTIQTIEEYLSAYCTSGSG